MSRGERDAGIAPLGGAGSRVDFGDAARRARACGCFFWMLVLLALADCGRLADGGRRFRADEARDVAAGNSTPAARFAVVTLALPFG